MWPVNSLTICDIVVSYFLGTQTTTSLPRMLAEFVSHHPNKYATPFFDCSENGEAMLAGLDVEELRTLLKKILASASFANDGLELVACTITAPIVLKFLQRKSLVIPSKTTLTPTYSYNR